MAPASVIAAAAGVLEEFAFVAGGVSWLVDGAEHAAAMTRAKTSRRDFFIWADSSRLVCRTVAFYAKRSD